MINSGGQRTEIGSNWPLTGPYFQRCDKEIYFQTSFIKKLFIYVDFNTNISKWQYCDIPCRYLQYTWFQVWSMRFPRHLLLPRIAGNLPVRVKTPEKLKHESSETSRNSTAVTREDRKCLWALIGSNCLGCLIATCFIFSNK